MTATKMKLHGVQDLMCSPKHSKKTSQAKEIFTKNFTEDTEQVSKDVLLSNDLKRKSQVITNCPHKTAKHYAKVSKFFFSRIF